MNKIEFIEFAKEYNIFEKYDFIFKDTMMEIILDANLYNVDYNILTIDEIIHYINSSKYIINLTNIGSNYICSEGTNLKNVLKRKIKINKLKKD